MALLTMVVTALVGATHSLYPTVVCYMALLLLLFAGMAAGVRGGAAA
jgi:hypothetical protein